MKNKKKFHFNLDKDLKPNLDTLIEQSEKEFMEYAQKIYGIGTNEKKEDFKIEDLYQPTPNEDIEIVDSDYLKILENARLEAVEKAAKILKNKR